MDFYTNNGAKTLTHHWWILCSRRIVLQPEFEAIGVEDAVNSVQNSMKNLVQHYDE